MQYLKLVVSVVVFSFSLSCFAADNDDTIARVGKAIGSTLKDIAIKGVESVTATAKNAGKTPEQLRAEEDEAVSRRTSELLEKTLSSKNDPEIEAELVRLKVEKDRQEAAAATTRQTPSPTPVATQQKPKVASAENSLENFGSFITSDQKVIGRDSEIKAIMQVLLKRDQNNPLVHGDSGVGKSAVITGLAQALSQDSTPRKLKNKKIFSLNLTTLIAGAGARGSLETRVQQIISNLQDKKDEIILYIDKIEQLYENNASAELKNIGMQLKNALSSGSIQCIATATTDSKAASIDKDASLRNLFGQIVINEPRADLAIEILSGIQTDYENHHGVEITDAAISTAVRLSSRYMKDSALPQKAINLLDDAASFVSINATDDTKPVVDDGSVADAVSRITGIPANKMNASESEKLLNLEQHLGERVIGQDPAVSAVAKKIRISRAGLQNPTKPIGSFLFLGPTGVGKTEIAKAIAQIIFDDPKALIRIDMSEYGEKQAVSRLIGAAPGYVGFEEAGQLTGNVRKQPYAVVLFDELEKAHPDIFDILLQVLDEGRLTDSHGRTVDFSNTIIIATSNIGALEILAEKDPERQKAVALENLKEYLRPEFINRFSDIVAFNRLTEASLKGIAKNQLKGLKELLKNRNLSLVENEEALLWLAKHGYDPEMGARPLGRLIENKILSPLAQNILQNLYPSGSVIHLGVKDDALSFESTCEAALTVKTDEALTTSENK